MMTDIEKKEKEIAEKWKSKQQKENIEDPFKFYRKNLKMIYEDLEELYLLCKSATLKQKLEGENNE